MEKQDLEQLKQRFSGKSILILGDVMLDRYVRGKVNRVSPEAPVPILEWQSCEDRLGGAANVALNCLALGAHVRLVSIIGNDEEGNRFTECLSASGLDASYLVRSDRRRTTTKTRIMASQQHLIRIDAEDTSHLDENEEAAVRVAWQSAWIPSSPDLVIFQDYDKGLLSAKLIADVIEQCQQGGIPVVVDPKRRQFWDYSGVLVFKPNLKELSDALGQPVQTDPDSLLAAIQQVRERMSQSYVLVTLGSRGMFLASPTESQFIAPVPIQLSDVCGAGDTVISVLAMAIASGLTVAEAAELANHGAAWVCTQPGVVPVQWEAWDA